MKKHAAIWASALLFGLGFYLALPLNSSAVEDSHPANPPAVRSESAANPPIPLLAEESAPNAPPANEKSAPPKPTDTVSADKPPAKLPAAADLDSAIDRWRQTLSKEKGFEAWQKATWTSYPLGPGTHGYVVLLFADGREVGYMIVGATKEGTYQLTEYGTGSKPLFSLTTLYRSLVQQELISDHTTLAQFINDKSIKKERIYFDALHALWKMTIDRSTYYLDAKTGEVLPIEESMLPKQAVKEKTVGIDPSVLSDQLQLPSFDPYDRINWVKGKPLALPSCKELKAALNKPQRITFVAELYGGKVTVPLAVVGYQLWNKNEPYLVLDQDGPRYVPLSAAIRQGRFYP
jgi:hypothetical protein